MLHRTLKILPRCPKLKKVIVMEDQLDGVKREGIEDLNGVTVIPFRKLIKAGEEKDVPK